MRRSIFKEGGPHNIKKTGKDEYSLSVQLPIDENGLLGRECPSNSCSPAYFKVKIGTGITEDYNIAYCPYCRNSAEPENFTTKEQVRYAKDITMQEAHKGIGDMLEDALGLGPSRRKKIGGGLLSMELQYKPGHPPTIRRPVEEELRRDVICPHCGLHHAVYGLATWCSDCGYDIFMTHVEREYQTVKDMLIDVDRRRSELGPRVAARDIENALEDTVSIFEAVLRVMIRRHLIQKGKSENEINKLFRSQIRNKFQNIDSAEKLCIELTQTNLLEELDENENRFLILTYEKRHPITHNLGVIDKKYLEKAMAGGFEGRDVPVTSEEIGKAIELSLKVLTNFHEKLFSS